MEAGSAIAARAPTCQTTHKFIVWHLNTNHMINLLTQFTEHLVERLSLAHIARKAIQHIAFGAVFLRDALFHQPDDDAVGDQSPLIHIFLCFQPQRRALL